MLWESAGGSKRTATTGLSPAESPHPTQVATLHLGPQQPPRNAKQTRRSRQLAGPVLKSNRNRGRASKVVPLTFACCGVGRPPPIAPRPGTRDSLVI